MLEPETKDRELSLSKKEKKEKEKAEKDKEKEKEKADKKEKKEKEKSSDKGGFFTKRRSSSLRGTQKDKDGKPEGTKDDSHILVRTSSKERKISGAKAENPVDKEGKHKSEKMDVCFIYYLFLKNYYYYSY